jgi:hypothetical protein
MGLSILILAAFMLPALQAQEKAEALDLFTGLPVRPSDQELRTLPSPMGSPEKTTQDIEVLWDLTHGVYFGLYTPSMEYSNVAAHLGGSGYAVTETSDIGSETLSNYDILVICVGSAWDEPYTVAEADAIENFVQNGGGLLIMGDMATSIPNDHVNVVAQRFGITCGVTGIPPADVYFNDFASHPLFSGISQIYYRVAGTLTAAPPGEAVAWYSGDPVVAAAEFGFGRVVATGDVNFCDNDYLAMSDNQAFSENIFAWLGTPEGWTGGPFDFNDGTVQGWTLEGAYDEGGGGAFSSNFMFGWKDPVNFPNPPGGDPMGDDNGSLQMFTLGGHGITNPGATWWIMQFYSPDLSGSPVWQITPGYDVRIAECMASLGTLYANLFVAVFDHDLGYMRYFYNGTAQPMTHDVYGDGSADYNHFSFDWSGGGFPTHYTLHHVFINIWGQMSTPLEGGVYLDEVIPSIGTLAPDISLTPPSFDIALTEGETTEEILNVNNVGNWELLYNVLTEPSGAPFKTSPAAWKELVVEEGQTLISALAALAPPQPGSDLLPDDDLSIPDIRFPDSKATLSGNVMITGWGNLGTSTAFAGMVDHLQSLGYTVSTSNTFPASLAGYDILILVGGGSADEDIPEGTVDDFVHAGNGLIVMEGVTRFDDYSTAAPSNPVASYSGWELRTNAHVMEPTNPLSTGLSSPCAFHGYSTTPTLKEIAQPALHWGDGAVMAATYEFGHGRVVYLNHLWIWYADIYWANDDTNGRILMENSLRFVHPNPVPWLRVVPSTGKLDPAGSRQSTLHIDASLLAPGDYWANLLVFSNDPMESLIGVPVHLSVSGSNVDTDPTGTPVDFSLLPNYPNPFNASTWIQFSLPESSPVTLKVVDLQGRTLRILANGEVKEAGRHQILWDGTDSGGRTLPSGVYLIQLQAGTFIAQQKATLLK